MGFDPVLGAIETAGPLAYLVWFTSCSGHLDEVVHQTWRGEKLLRERSFYDPGQLGA
ncbi:MAG: hypothetical protein J2P47_06715 [Acetobacteraceae bacterium]|nr:hypothetical protein [Acetobacteraceae bacterium]